MENLGVIQPTVELKQAYLEYIEEFRRAGETLIPFVLNYEADDFPGLIQRFENNSQGVDLQEGWVPHSTFWLVRDGVEVLGVANLRHRLTEFLRNEGGHIGYSVRPSARGRGFASYLLSRMLEKVKELGVSRALLTCDRDNLASAKVIKKNGGRFENEFSSERFGNMVHRYRIDLCRAGRPISDSDCREIHRITIHKMG